MISSLLKRFSEPSSYAGLAGLLGMFGINLSDPMMTKITMIAAGICGLASILMPEKSQ